jgi:hypothetical protein
MSEQNVPVKESDWTARWRGGPWRARTIREHRNLRLYAIDDQGVTVEVNHPDWTWGERISIQDDGRVSGRVVDDTLQQDLANARTLIADHEKTIGDLRKQVSDLSQEAGRAQGLQEGCTLLKKELADLKERSKHLSESFDALSFELEADREKPLK